MSAGRSASGSMPAWLISVSRRGEPEASTNLGRPIIIVAEMPLRRGLLAETKRLSQLRPSAIRCRRACQPKRALDARRSTGRAPRGRRRAAARGCLRSRSDRASASIRPRRRCVRVSSSALWCASGDSVTIRSKFEPLPVLQLLERHRPVRGDVDADLLQHRDRERIELALAHAGRARHRSPRPIICWNSAAAIGERTELSPQANSTACGFVLRGAIRHQPFQCSTQISVNSRRAVSKSTFTLRLRRVLQDARALVVQAAPAHVDRLDAVGRRGADRRVIAVADQEVVLDDAA